MCGASANHHLPRPPIKLHHVPVWTALVQHLSSGDALKYMKSEVHWSANLCWITKPPTIFFGYVSNAHFSVVSFVPNEKRIHITSNWTYFYCGVNCAEALEISLLFPSGGSAAIGITLGALGAAVLRARHAKTTTKAFENELGAEPGGWMSWMSRYKFLDIEHDIKAPI
jgi:hypothetical protein